MKHLFKQRLALIVLIGLGAFIVSFASNLEISRTTENTALSHSKEWRSVEIPADLRAHDQWYEK